MDIITQEVTLTRVWRPMDTFNSEEWTGSFVVFLDCVNGGYCLGFVSKNRQGEYIADIPRDEGQPDHTIGVFESATHWWPGDRQYDERFYPPGELRCS